MGRRGRVRGGGGRQIQDLAGLGAHLGRIHKAIAAHPDLIIGHRQIRDHIAALVVGDDHAGEFGGQVGGLGDDPDARFRPIGATNHAADVVGVNGDNGGFLGQGAGHGDGRGRDKGRDGRPQKESVVPSHSFLPRF